MDWLRQDYNPAKYSISSERPTTARHAKPGAWSKETKTPSPTIHALKACGKTAAAEFTANLGSKAETVRELCYRPYILCERKKRIA